ncbi:MAG: N-acetylmuramoyl-L-alanine amidase [Cyclobacteriaceae bacterium]
MHKLLFTFFLCNGILLTHPVFSQNESWVRRIDAGLVNGRVSSDAPFQSTAIVIKSEKYLGDSVSLWMDDDQYWLPMDPDAPEYTYFLSYTSQVSVEIKLDFDQEVVIYLINSGDPPNVNTSSRIESSNECNYSFGAIPQSEWRTGLPEPNYTRSATQVKHVVVHHSAGSNTNTNYTQVVRDIYLYHTQVNGWSDIGYNFLVAQDGSVYNGRDPGPLEQDDVLGAHFCGSNSTTMGICMLGNYESVQLNSANYMSLLDIITWKLDHEGLTPYSSNQHALGTFDAVIGHRDGCSTLCPGENVYSRLDEVKADVLNNLNCDDPHTMSLDFEASIQVTKARSTINFVNLSSGYDNYEWYFEGGIPETATWSAAGQVDYNYPGLFDVMLVGLSEGSSDTLFRETYVEIQGDPTVFPNPVVSFGGLSIQYHKEILEAELFALNGQEFELEVNDQGQYKLPFLLPGLYLLQLQTATEVIGRKILIQ